MNFSETVNKWNVKFFQQLEMTESGVKKDRIKNKEMIKVQKILILLFLDF